MRKNRSTNPETRADEFQKNPNIEKISSASELSLNSNYIKFNNDVIFNEFEPICLMKTTESDTDNCIDRETIINIINSFKHRDIL